MKEILKSVLKERLGTEKSAYSTETSKEIADTIKARLKGRDSHGSVADSSRLEFSPHAEPLPTNFSEFHSRISFFMKMPYLLSKLWCM